MGESMTEPIKPSDVTHKIPDTIIEVINKLIQEKWNGQEAIVYNEEILNALTSKAYDITGIFKKKHLDVETFYEKVGWKVSHESPSWAEGETFRSHFIFRQK